MSDTLVDGHVHFHDGFEPSLFLTSARENFLRAGRPGAVPAMLLAHIGSGDPLQPLREAVASGTDWQSEQIDEASMRCQHRDGFALFCIAGRQIVTEENLEVLSLCSAQAVQPRRLLQDTIQQVLDVGGVPVLPWGFGKWWFARGELIRDMIATAPPNVLLGDNGCRPSIWRPKMLDGSLPVLAGSDPLPLSSHSTRSGSYGSILPGKLDEQQPARWLHTQLCGQNGSMPTFGSCRSIPQFTCDQLLLRIAKS